MLRGSEVVEFVDGVLPALRKEGIDVRAYYVASTELFDMLPEARQREVLPEEHAREALGITGFTLATLYRFVTGEDGRRRSLSPFRGGHFLGSGKANKVLEQGGLNAAAQLVAIRDYVKSRG